MQFWDHGDTKEAKKAAEWIENNVKFGRFGSKDSNLYCHYYHAQAMINVGGKSGTNTTRWCATPSLTPNKRMILKQNVGSHGPETTTWPPVRDQRWKSTTASCPSTQQVTLDFAQSFTLGADFGLSFF